MALQARNFVFTLNNPEEFEIEDFPNETQGPLHPLLSTLKNLRYASYQYELGESFTPHFQGYLEFEAPTRISAIKSGELQFAHYEKRMGSRDQARDYTRKAEGRVAGPWEYGEWTVGQGNRSDLREAASTLLATRNLRELALAHPESFVRYHGGFAKLLEVTREAPRLPDPEQWRPWQTDCLQLLAGEPHPRRIHWFVDPDGGAGKSFLVRYLATNRGALPLGSGRHDRLLNAWNGESIVTFDFSRDVSSAGPDADRTPYAVIESIKNGVVFSGFFGTGPRIFPTPHVLCFSNFFPDESKLSMDRWDTRVVSSTPVPGPAPPVF